MDNPLDLFNNIEILGPDELGDDTEIIKALEKKIYGQTNPHKACTFDVPDFIEPASPDMEKYLKLREKLVLNIAASEDLDTMMFTQDGKVLEKVRDSKVKKSKLITKFKEQVDAINDSRDYDIVKETEELINEAKAKRNFKIHEILDILDGDTQREEILRKAGLVR